MTTRKKSTSWKWAEGNVDCAADHLELRYGKASEQNWESWIPVALVGKPVKRCFPVRWLIPVKKLETRAMVEEVLRELNFFLKEIAQEGNVEPWHYAKYHCSTASNIYSNVHWSYFPEGCTEKLHRE
jgi:hypothetical protein